MVPEVNEFNFIEDLPFNVLGVQASFKVNWTLYCYFSLLKSCAKIGGNAFLPETFSEMKFM